jgi:thymidylate synthase (FAD)
MKIVKQSYAILSPSGCCCGTKDLPAAFINEARLIERAGRTAYQSEDQISSDSYAVFIRKIISMNHTAILEFGSMTVKFITDRGVSHELVRHRLASFCQESTRYCSYAKNKFGNEITVIQPSAWDTWSAVQKEGWTQSVAESETAYLRMIACGISPQEARAVLPNSLKTEIAVRANFREWRHIFKLRAVEKSAHPDMRRLMIPLYLHCRELLPCAFDLGDIE